MISSFFYLLGCMTVLIAWWTAAKREANEKGKLDVTVGNVLTLVCLALCSWLGFAKVVLSSYKPEWYKKVIYTFKGGNDENQTDVHSDAD